MVFCAHWKEKLLFISRGRVSFFYPILDITSPSDRAVDKDPYSFSPPDPDPGEKNLRKKKNARKLVVIVCKFEQLNVFFTFEQSFLSFSTPENSS